MVDEKFGVRDDGVITSGVPLTIWRGATQALDRGFSNSYEAKRGGVESWRIDVTPLSEDSKEVGSGEESAGEVCCGVRNDNKLGNARDVCIPFVRA